MWRKEGNGLFNDAFNTFYLRLYGVRHMVKVHKDRDMGYSLRLAASVLLYAPYHGLCYTSRGALAGTRNSSMGQPHERSIRRPIAPWANALPLSYVPLPKVNEWMDGWMNEWMFNDSPAQKTDGLFSSMYFKSYLVGFKWKYVHDVGRLPTPTRLDACLMWPYAKLEDYCFLLSLSKPTRQGSTVSAAIQFI